MGYETWVKVGVRKEIDSMAAQKTAKVPQKGAVAKITAERAKLRKQPASSKLREIFRKENDTSEQPQKKIAAKSTKREPDLGL